jgi:mannan endo-1,4-beta-mannosidase
LTSKSRRQCRAVATTGCLGGFAPVQFPKQSTRATRSILAWLSLSLTTACAEFHASAQEDAAPFTETGTGADTGGTTATKAVVQPRTADGHGAGGSTSVVPIPANGGNDQGKGGNPTAASTDSGGSVQTGIADGGTGNVFLGTVLRFEAEAAVLSDGATRQFDPTASSGSYADMNGSGTVPAAGTYDLTIVSSIPVGWGTKTNDVFANGSLQTSFVTDDRNATGAFYAQSNIWIQLEAGTNSLAVKPSWGWVRLDYVEIRDVQTNYRDISTNLNNPVASSNARRLMRFLSDNYGRRVISGQQGFDYVATVKALTDREPALVGFDLMDYSPSRLDYMAMPVDGETERAIAWWRDRKGLVTLCWHWNAPTGLLNKTYVDSQGNLVDAQWYKGFYTFATTFDLAGALADPNSTNYHLILRDIDAIAVQLKKLQAVGVPLLWRPLHEASGGWFWWGAKGPAAYISLYRLLYDRLTNYHQLDNLIWVQNGQHPDWYPGDDVVDVVGEDIYGPKRDYGPQVGRFSMATRYSKVPKLVALSENGALMDPNQLRSSMASWSWFNVWSGDEFIVTEDWNENWMKRAVYQSEYVITLDELPDITNLAF